MPNPNATFERSPGSGVRPAEPVSAIVPIRENPALGIGLARALPEGPGLALFQVSAGADVMNSESPALSFLAAFFFFVFSVLPLDKGCVSMKSATCGTALQSGIN
jgi:hypothetical protein